MSKMKIKKKLKRNSVYESDGAYFLKLTLFLVIGAQWLRLTDLELTRQIPIPIGLIVGLLLARNERFKFDRKIEYAILLIAMFVGFWTHMGIYMPIL